MKTKHPNKKELLYGEIIINLHDNIRALLTHQQYDLEIYNLAIKLKKELEAFMRQYM